MPSATTFHTIAPGLGWGSQPPVGWQPVQEQPLLCFVGLTGVGKTTTLGILAGLLEAAGRAFTHLPDRRRLTDQLIIAHLQRQDGEPVRPVIDRAQRFRYTRRYRQEFPGGMAHALSQLWVDPTQHPGLLLFDGLRGENEVTFAARHFPQARFVVLHAPDGVRVQRLLGRQDAFDRIAAGVGIAAGPERGAPVPDLATLAGKEAADLFSPAETQALLALLQDGRVGPEELAAKVRIVLAERANYDPDAARRALERLAPQRTLLVDTTRLDPQAAAHRIAAFVGSWPSGHPSLDGRRRTKDGGQRDIGFNPQSPVSQPPSPQSTNRPANQSSSSPLSIAHIETIPFRLPLHGALRWGRDHAMDEVRHVLVRVTLSDGSQGVAEAPPRPTIYGETVQSIQGIIAQELAPRILGLPVDEPGLVQIHQRLHQVKNNPAAKAGVDMALHHALAVSQGISLAQRLGAQRERVRVSYILGIGPLEEMLAEAERVVAAGVRVLKVKVGRDWTADLARIQALQQTLGPDVTLYADANECFSPEEAPDRLAALAELGLAYCEEPLPVEQVQERARLQAQDILPLIADDSTFTLRDLRRELALDTFHILNIKTARTGYTESQAMLALARARDKGAMVGSQASAGLGTARAGLFAGLPGVEHPCELSFFLKLKEDIIDRPIPIRDGFLDLADLLRVQVDEDRLREARLPRL